MFQPPMGPPLFPLVPLANPSGSYVVSVQSNVIGVNENLSVVVPLNYFFLSTHISLLTFNGYGHEDPHLHMRDFANFCVSNQVINQEYFCMWFLTTLKGEEATWYWAQLARTFVMWVELRTAF